MPEWLTGLLQGLAREGPPLGILVVFGWLVFRHQANQHNQHLKDLAEYIKTLAEQHKRHLASLNAKQEAELTRLEGVHEKAMASKDGEISRLLSEKGIIQKERDDLFQSLKAEHKK
jgi:hypothetical protein